IRNPRTPWSSWRTAIATLLVFWAVLSPLRLLQDLPLTGTRRAEKAQARADAARIVAQMRAADGVVLSDNLIMVQQAGKEVFSEAAIVNHVARAGSWDQSD